MCESYGFAPPNVTAALITAFYSMSPMSACTTLDCLNNVSASDLIKGQDQLVNTAPFTIRGVPFSLGQLSKVTSGVHI